MFHTFIEDNVVILLMSSSFCAKNDEISQASIRIGLLEKRLENVSKEVSVFVKVAQNLHNDAAVV